MINTVATFALGALLAAFAISAVLLNEGQHAARRRLRARPGGAPAPSSETQVDLLHAPGPQASRGDGRRLPVGDFLFGALLLRGHEPFVTADLAAVATDSGLDISQVLAWLDKAEQSGIIERLDASVEEGLPSEPSVRLTAEGLQRARENRRGARRAAPLGP